MPEPYLFINYRIKDTAILADGIRSTLQGHFGDVVFLDNSEIDIGEEFPAPIETALGRATCMLVLIGEEWLHQHDPETGRRRLDLPGDWVRMEIERALARPIDLIPVLAPGTTMPIEEAFPDSIRSLSKRIPFSFKTKVTYVQDRMALVELLESQHGFQKKQPTLARVTSQVGHRGETYSEALKAQTPQEPIERSRGPKAWVNGTVLHYYFIKHHSSDAEARWAGREPDFEVVRQALYEWKSAGIGLFFEEVASPEEAEIRVGFGEGEGSWAYMGRDALDQLPPRPTMNFDWSLAQGGGLDTALHEVGHLLGFSEEHQNPNSGIVWNEEVVYAAMSESPYLWTREMIDARILRKGEPDQYYGPWDPDSIMHFAFPEGHILEPSEYREGLFPTPGLSAGDMDKVRFLYPALTLEPTLVPLDPVPLAMQPGEQGNFLIVPSERRVYDFQTFGPGQVAMILSEDREGRMERVAADDNTGEARSSHIAVPLELDRRYVLGVRFFGSDGDTSLMMW